MNMNMKVRHLEDADDIRATVHVTNMAWREAYRGILPDEVLARMGGEPPDEQVQEAFEQRRDDRDRFLVAENDAGSICGYVYLQWGEETKTFVGEAEAGLKEIYVHPDYWGQGFGTKLLERGLELVPEDIERVKLEALSDNEIGHRFYMARGFDRTGTGNFEIAGEAYPTAIYTLEL